MRDDLPDTKPVLKTIPPEKVESSIRSFANFFLIGGGVLIIFFLIHLLELIQNGYAPVNLYNSIINLAWGVCFLMCRYFLRRRKAAVVYLFGGLLMVNILICGILGLWVNIAVLVIVGGSIWIYLFGLRYQKELR